jgi:nucleoside transporter
MFLNYATQGAFVPLFSLRLESLGFSPLEIGWACSTQALAALVGPLVVGQIADRYFPAQRCLTVCAFVGGALLWVIAGLTTPLSVFIASLAIWLVLSPANTLCAALSFAHLPDPERDFGPVRLWGTIGWVTANWVLLLNFFILGDEPERLADIFRLAGTVAFAMSFYALTLPHTPPRKRAEAWLAPLAAFRLLRGRSFRVFWVCSFGVCVTLPFFMQLAPLLLQHHGIPRRWIAPTMTLAQSMEIISLALLPMLLLRLSIRGTMLLGLLAWMVLQGALARGEPIGLVIAALSLNGLCICCFIVAGQVFVNSRARGDVRASAQALFAFINALGLLTGNLLVGWVHQAFDKEFPPTFAVSALIASFLVLVFMIAFREDRPVFTPVAAGLEPATPPITNRRQP